MIHYSLNSSTSRDVAIAEARIRYAAEHIDFHSFFGRDTVPDLQRVLRNEAPLTPAGRNRRDVVARLFQAQRHTPHLLWTLLLLQVFEKLLMRRRRRLGEAFDARIVETFVAALENLPMSVASRKLGAYVTVLSRKALFREVAKARAVAS